MAKKKDKKTVTPSAVPRVKRRPLAEVRSDRMTAAYLSRMLKEHEQSLGDLVPEMQYLERYDHQLRLTYVLDLLKDLRGGFDKFAETGVWDDRS